MAGGLRRLSPVNRRAWLGLVVALLPPVAGARDYSAMYSEQELRRAHDSYAANVRGVLREDMGGYLTGEELETLDRARLHQPWNRTRDPFEVSANPATGVILLPTLSVKFLDDLAVALAWFERFGCNQEAVFDYVAALDFGTAALPAPLEALGVPPRAYELDDYVDDVSQKILKSAIAFLLAHELGHIHHRHRPYGEINAAEARAQEAEADRFAMEVLRRVRLPPLGMAVWLTAVSMRDPLVEGSPRQTHPLSASRLHAIASGLRHSPEDFIGPTDRRMSVASILGVADSLDTLGRQLGDRDLRSVARERGRLATPALLAGACEPELHDRHWEQQLERFFGHR